MIDATEVPDAIQWHEGMLLAPQHFQQAAARTEALLRYHTAASAPWHWGVRRLRLDHVLLIEGIFRVLELEAVMPDGLIISHHHAPDQALELDLNGREADLRRSPGRIHLAVPALHIGKGIADGRLPRYDSVEGQEIPDENTGDSGLRIPRLRPRISLLFMERPPAKYTFFPLAELQYKNETFSLTDHIPPQLQVLPRTPLWDLCASISRRIREKAVVLSERITSPASPVKGPKALETRMMLHFLVSALPPFEAAVNSGKAHPFLVWQALAGLVGAQAGLGNEYIPPVLPAYDHHELRRCFETGRQYLFRIMDEGIQESHTAILFDFADGVFSIDLRPEWLDRHLVIGLAQRPGWQEKDSDAWLDDCIIGVVSMRTSMEERRILGAGRRRIDHDGELVPSAGTLLYAVSLDPEFIAADQKLLVFNSSDRSAERGPLEILLYIRNVPANVTSAESQEANAAPNRKRRDAGEGSK